MPCNTSLPWRIAVPKFDDLSLRQQFFRYIALSLRQSIEMQEELPYGIVFLNGTATGTVGLMQSNHVDIIGCDFVATNDRIAVFKRVLHTPFFTRMLGSTIHVNAYDFRLSNRFQWTNSFTIEMWSVVVVLYLTYGIIRNITTVRYKHAIVVASFKLQVLFMAIQWIFGAVLFNYAWTEVKSPIADESDVASAIMERGMRLVGNAEFFDDKIIEKVARTTGSQYTHPTAQKQIIRALKIHPPEIKATYRESLQFLSTSTRSFIWEVELDYIYFCLYPANRQICVNTTTVRAKTRYHIPAVSFVSAYFSKFCVERLSNALQRASAHGEGERINRRLKSLYVGSFQPRLQHSGCLTIAEFRLIFRLLSVGLLCCFLVLFVELYCGHCFWYSS